MYLKFTYTFKNADGRRSWNDCRVEAINTEDGLAKFEKLMTVFVLRRLVKLELAFLFPVTLQWLDMSLEANRLNEFIEQHREKP